MKILVGKKCPAAFRRFNLPVVATYIRREIGWLSVPQSLPPASDSSGTLNWRATTKSFFSCLLVLGVSSLSLSAQTALVRHAPTLNGTVDGSLQQMTGESVALNGGAVVTGDLLAPGTPVVQLNSAPNYGGTLEGSGLVSPSGYYITLNGQAALRHVIRRINPLTLPAVAAVPTSSKTASVTINAAGQSIAWSTLKNLTLNGGVGQFAVPAGTYGNFIANSNCGFTLGVAGATQPSVYNLQALTLNGPSTLLVVGPVIINLANGLAANGPVGMSNNPAWLTLNIKSGGLTLNSASSFHGYVLAPSGTVIINANSRLVGGLTCDRLIVNGSGLVKLQAQQAANQSPSVSLTAPASGSSFLSPAGFTLTATAGDSSIAKVEFFQGTVKIGQRTSAPYGFVVSNLGAGSYTYFARATDNLGAATDSSAISITVTSPNQPPTVALTAPTDGAVFTAPGILTLIATAADSDGTVDRVDFFQGSALIGSDASAPYSIGTTALPVGTYVFSAKAFDNAGASKTSDGVTVTVIAPNQAPTVSINAPLDDAVFDDPAAFVVKANAADSDGSIAKVELFLNGTLTGTTTQMPYRFSVSGLAVGTYDFVARATDNLNSSADSTPVRVTVAHVNDAPIANAQSQATPEETPLSLTLGGSDADGDVLSVLIVSRPTHGTLVSGSTANTFIYTPDENFNGNDSFAFKISDGVLESPPATVQLTATPVNDVPVTYPVPVVLNENTSASFVLAATDVDSSGLIFTIMSPPSHGTCSGSLPNVTYTPAVDYSGSDSMIYRAFDGVSFSAPSTVNITVNHVNRLPSVTLTAPATGSSFIAPATFTLQATAYDSDGNVTKVEFFQGLTKIGESTVAPYQLAVSAVSTGSYSYTARATDNLNTTSDSAAVSVTVVINNPPAVSLTAPADGATLTAPASIALSVIASDSDGTIAHVDFYQGSTLIGQSSTAPYSFTTSALAAGIYNFSAKAYDNLGAIGTTDAATVTVANPNQPPTVVLTSPAENELFTSPASVVLTAVAGDSDGTVTKVEFYDNGIFLGETPVPTTPNTFTFWFTPSVAGSHSLSARATDDKNATTDSAPVVIMVNNPNQGPSITLSTSASTLSAPGILTLTADAADGDGTIANVEFFLGGNSLGQVLTPSQSPSGYAFPLSLYSAGTYSLTAVATDNSGLKTTSNAVVIDVQSGAASLPFVANFEAEEGYVPGQLLGQLSWMSTMGVQVIPATAPGSQQELFIPAAQPVEIYSHDFSAAGVSPVFVDFQARPVAGTDPTTAVMFSTPAAQVALVGSTSPAHLWIFGGGVGWYPTGQTIPIDANGRTTNWIRLTTREDYVTKRWDAYLNGKMIAADVAFADASATSLTDFSVNGHPTTASAFDSFYAAVENPIFADVNHNGLDDAWETARGLSLAADNRQLSPTGNGVSVLQAYLGGTDPNDFYNGSAPTLTIVSGNNQIGTVSTFNAQPFLVSVRDAVGSILANAPVTFTVQSGGGELASDDSGATNLSTTLTLHTGSEGTAQIYYRHSAVFGTPSIIGVTAGTAAVVFQSSSQALVLSNQPPTVSLAAPIAGMSFVAPATILLRATAGDPDGVIAKVEFFQGNIKLGEALTAPFEFNWANAVAGNYSLTARATDDRSAQTVSSPVIIQISPASVPTPVVELTDPENGITCLQGSLVTLKAQGFELNGRLAKIEFYVDGALFDTRTFATALDTTQPVTTVWNATGLGPHTIVARAYDTFGMTADSSSTIIQVATNTAPSISIVSPSNGTLFDLGATINFRASPGSSGSVVKVEFYSDGILIGTTTDPLFRLAVSTLPAGTHHIRARVYDTLGGVGISVSTYTTIVRLPVPYAVDFESSEGFSTGLLKGGRGWNATTGTTWVKNVGTAPGTQALVLDAAPNIVPALTQYFSSLTPTDADPLFVDFVVRLPAGDTLATAPVISVVSRRVALVREGDIGRLYAYDYDGESGSGWIATRTMVALGADGLTSDWLHLTARQFGRWDLYVNSRLVAIDLHSSGTFETISITGVKNTEVWLDHLSVGYTHPLFVDADHDGMDDDWESSHGLDPTRKDRNEDPDQDGLTNVQEFIFGTDPNNADTDADGLPDGWEVARGYDPLRAEPLSVLNSDTDNDGLTLLQEAKAGADPNEADTDGDGIPDGAEIHLGLNPLSSVDTYLDSDGDGVTNRQEYLNGTDPNSFYNGAVPVVASLLSPGGELGPDGLFSILVTRSDGTLLVNAPVTFTTVVDGSPMVLSPDDSVETKSITVRTGPDGVAKVYLKGRHP